MPDFDREIQFLLEKSDARLRRDIRNLCVSYSHPWDVLAELCQNSVDAIRRHVRDFGSDPKDHSINITIDATDRSIRIYDTGIGFNPEEIPELLAPGGSDKDLDADLIGEKGVGLTYSIFTCNHYELETASAHGHAQAVLESAMSWRRGTTTNMPTLRMRLDAEPVAPGDTYTSIILRDVEKRYDDEEDIFSQSLAALSFLIRTRTAVGSTAAVFAPGTEMPVTVRLTRVDKSGTSTAIEVSPTYALPEGLIPESRILIVDDEFFRRLAPMKEAQKRAYLKGNSLVYSGQKQVGGRWIHYHLLFVPERAQFAAINKAAKLVEDENDDTSLYQYGPEITLASKGMPTGILIEAPKTGSSGYWHNIFMLFQDDSLEVDVGRKSIADGRTHRAYKQIAKDVFNELVGYFVLVGGGIAPPVNPYVEQWEKKREFEQLKTSLPDLNVNGVNIVKHPGTQEANVVALFHELVAAGILSGYYTYTMGYKLTYDLWGQYRIAATELPDSPLAQRMASSSGFVEADVVIEFKYRAENVLADFEDNTKVFETIDLLVCWDFDPQKFKRQGLEIVPAKPEEILFKGVNYRILLPQQIGIAHQIELPVISLRQLLDAL